MGVESPQDPTLIAATDDKPKKRTARKRKPAKLKGSDKALALRALSY